MLQVQDTFIALPNNNSPVKYCRLLTIRTTTQIQCVTCYNDMNHFNNHTATLSKEYTVHIATVSSNAYYYLFLLQKCGFNSFYNSAGTVIRVLMMVSFKLN